MKFHHREIFAVGNSAIEKFYRTEISPYKNYFLAYMLNHYAHIF